jgi:DNA topoisomerase-1
MTVVERLQSSGIQRTGSPKRGFRYQRPGAAAPVLADRERIQSLAIPPAWTDVWISASPASAVQAIGKDRAGRWQYLYSEKQARIREERKGSRLLAFLGALPQIRARVGFDVRGEGLKRERVLAAMVRLLLRGFLRPGSAAYTRENGTYGLSTLRRRHVRVEKGVVTLSYIGKGGKPQVRRVADAAAAAVVSELLRQAGPWLFRYRSAEGQWVKVRRQHINDYLQEIAGSRFSAKDFRTWAGTLFGASALARQERPDPASPRALRLCVTAAMRETAQLLGNTPAVCRSSYVSPAVLSAFEKGRVLAKPLPHEALLRASPRTLSIVERRLVRLIRNGSIRRARRLARA